MKKTNIFLAGQTLIEFIFFFPVMFLIIAYFTQIFTTSYQSQIAQAHMSFFSREVSIDVMVRQYGTEEIGKEIEKLGFDKMGVTVTTTANYDGSQEFTKYFDDDIKKYTSSDAMISDGNHSLYFPELTLTTQTDRLFGDLFSFFDKDDDDSDKKDDGSDSDDDGSDGSDDSDGDDGDGDDSSGDDDDDSPPPPIILAKTAYTLTGPEVVSSGDIQDAQEKIFKDFKKNKDEADDELNVFAEYTLNLADWIMSLFYSDI